MEELIDQCDEFNELYEHSINTIRIVTLNGELIGAVLRMGIGGSKIDNASAGGIMAAVDVKTGVVISVGKTYLCEEYTLHPDTQKIIPGFVIPQWKECIEYIENAIKMCPGIPCIGWDIAITPEGPTIVEVNEGTEMELLELAYGKGFRRIIRKQC